MFGQPEVGLGITPGFGGTQRLARLVGAGMAKQMIYTARNIKADEALRIGLVNAVYPQEELLPQAKKIAQAVISNGNQSGKPMIRMMISKAFNLWSGLTLFLTSFSISSGRR